MLARALVAFVVCEACFVTKVAKDGRIWCGAQYTAKKLHKLMGLRSLHTELVGQ